MNKKVFLEELSRYEEGRYKGKINWMGSIGMSVRFIYGDIEGELLILDITRDDKMNTHITTEYGDCRNLSMSIGSFTNCNIGGLIGKKMKKYRFHIGEIVELVRSGKLEILEQIRIPRGNHTEKGYKYKCSICGNIDDKSESNLIKNKGCTVCSGQKLLKGFNDLWTTHPKIAVMFKYPEIGYTISFGSKTKQIFICPDCGHEKSSSLSNVVNRGLCCPKCSDGISYPNKFIFNVMEQLGTDFETEKIFDWSDNKRYDFYTNSRNILIEAQGGQHYKYTGRGRSLIDEQYNDKLKERLANTNGVGDDGKYIVIDCRKSELEFIRKNILNSRLSELFDLTDIDWLKCHEYACKSLVKVICNLWDGNIQNVADELKISKDTVRKCLKQGNELNFCKYNAKEESKKILVRMSKDNLNPVICLTTEGFFYSIKDAFKWANLKSGTGINLCCSGRRKTSGKHPKTGEPLRWMYYDEYVKLQEAI